MTRKGDRKAQDKRGQMAAPRRGFNLLRLVEKKEIIPMKH